MSSVANPVIDQSVIPKTIQNFKVLIQNFEAIDLDIETNHLNITELVSEVSMFESIFKAFIHGFITVIDNSGIISSMPLIGQEKLLIQWEKDARLYQKVFYTVNIFDVRAINDQTITYGIEFTQEKQLKNTVSLFSKSYKDTAHGIIQSVYDNFLANSQIPESRLDVRIESKSKHGITFPYMKPLKAIDVIMKNTLALDGTPMLLFETFYGEEGDLSGRPILSSYADLYTADPIPNVVIRPKQIARDSSDPEADYRATIFTHNFTKNYSTLDMLSRGAFGAGSTVIDLSIMSAKMRGFSFREPFGSGAPPIANDWISDRYRIEVEKERLQAHQIWSTRNITVFENKYAYEDDEYPTIYGTDLYDRQILNSYMIRSRTALLSVYMDAITTIKAGDTIETTLPTYFPKTEDIATDDSKTNDLINSGKFLVASVRHYIKNREYTISAELIRDGIGQGANLYPDRSPVFNDPIEVPTLIQLDGDDA